MSQASELKKTEEDETSDTETKEEKTKRIISNWSIIQTRVMRNLVQYTDSGDKKTTSSHRKNVQSMENKKKYQL
jgi:hypothetical protein